MIRALFPSSRRGASCSAGFHGSSRSDVNEFESPREGCKDPFPRVDAVVAAGNGRRGSLAGRDEFE